MGIAIQVYPINMKLGFYRVDNSKGYERHTFDDIYEQPEKIEEMLRELRDDEEINEYCIIDLTDAEYLDWFTDEYNNERFDGGWWCVLIRDK